MKPYVYSSIEKALDSGLTKFSLHLDMSYTGPEEIMEVAEEFEDLKLLSINENKAIGLYVASFDTFKIPEDHSADLLGMSETFSEAQAGGMEAAMGEED